MTSVTFDDELNSVRLSEVLPVTMMSFCGLSSAAAVSATCVGSVPVGAAVVSCGAP
ncbi:hypothetical protein MOP88_02145 [Sphingomonas sp. WKB10]|nr:hypothetical protein [Sphingomonas sp. WKB10]